MGCIPPEVHVFHGVNAAYKSRDSMRQDYLCDHSGSLSWSLEEDLAYRAISDKYYRTINMFLQCQKYCLSEASYQLGW